MKLGWRGALGIVLSAGLLWWAFKDVPVADVRAQLAQSNLPLFLLSAAVATTIFPLRAIRWRVILDPVAHGLPLGALWRATAIGMMVNNVAVARAGEFARAFALTRETNRVGFMASVASLAVDRSFDAVVLTSMLVLSVLAPGFPREMLVGGQPASRYALFLSIGVVALFAALYAFVFMPTLILRIYDATAG